jgi:hypothetical protein
MHESPPVLYEIIREGDTTRYSTRVKIAFFERAERSRAS